MKKSLNEYPSSTVVEVQEWISVTYSISERELKKKVLHNAMSTILNKIEKICLQVFHGRTGRNIRVKCYSILS